MAESLPRYQRPGVLLGEMPRFDMANTREAMKGSQQLNESLGALSRWAFEQAAVEAKERGEQYGAENPVTVQQLLDGTASFADKGSIYGKAARGVQLDTVTTELGIEAENKLAGLKARAKAGEIDVVGALAEIKDMQDGYSSALARVDPKASNKFRASIATAGNSILLGIQEEAGKKAIERQKISVDSWVNDTLPSMVQSHIDAGDTKDPESGQTITPKMRIDAMRSTLRGALVAIGDADYARGAMKQFEETITRSQVNAVSAFVASDEFIKGDPSAALARVRAGDVGRYASTYRALPAAEQEKVRTNLMQEVARVHTLNERTEKDAEQAQKSEVYTLMSRYWGMPEGRAKAALRAEIVSKGRGVISFDQLKTLLKPEGGSGEPKESPDALRQAEHIIRRQGVTDLAEVVRRVPNLSGKQKRALQDYLYDAGDRELRDTIKTIAGIPEGLIEYNGAQRKRLSALNQEADRLKQESIKRDGQWDPKQVLGQLREKREQLTVDKEAETSRKRLTEYATAAGISEIPENASRADLQAITKKNWYGGAAPVFNPQQISEIDRHLKIIRGE